MPPYQNGPDNHGPQPSPAAPLQSGPNLPPSQQTTGNRPSIEDPAHRYDFFLNPEKQQRKPLLAGGLFSNKLLFAGVGLVSIFIVLMAFALLNSGNKPNSDPLVSVAQIQVELIRVSQNGILNNQSTDLKNFSVNISETISSAEQQLVAKIASTGLKVTDKQLNLDRSTQTDQALSAAVAASTYDTTYKTIMQNNLDTYISRLEAAAATTTSRSTKALLQSDHDGAELLEKQLNQI